MKIVIAPDSFKGSLTAKEAGDAIRRGMKKVVPKANIVVVPMADGGEGTLQCLIDATGGRLLHTVVKNPIGIEIPASYGILGDGHTCVIEMATASGLYLIDEDQRNPLYTTTYGFGQLIRAGLDQGCRRFILGLGGSATNDGGAGMLQALGFRLLDAHGQQIGYGGGAVGNIAAIDTSEADPRLAESTYIAACDVTNPFVGPNGASFVFGPQKGATPEMVRQLDDNLRHFADVIHATQGISIHELPGAGAAGGVAGAILALLNGALSSGFDIVKEVAKLEHWVQDADLVFTGEGQVDYQTAQGKTPCGVARVAKAYGVPVVVLAGSVGHGMETLYQQGVTAVLSIVNQPMPLSLAMEQAADLLEMTAEQVMRIFLHQVKR